jgi:hypothetical protein
VFKGNTSLDTADLRGLVSVEYRLLVPVKRSGLILGQGGSVRAGDEHLGLRAACAAAAGSGEGSGAGAVRGIGSCARCVYVA